MRPGDERRPMSILERISDEPLDPEPYIDYLIEHYRAHRGYWDASPNDRDPDKPTARECVLLQMEFFLMALADIKRKMHWPDSR